MPYSATILATRGYTTSSSFSIVYASCFAGALFSGCGADEAASAAAEFTLSAIKKTVSDESHWYGVKFEKIIPEIVEFAAKIKN